MNKHDVEYRMYSLKNFCEIFDELFSYNTGDDFWKRCVCEATIRDLNVDICDAEVEQCPEDYLCGCFRFRLSKLCPFAYSADYSEFMKMVKKQGIENYINKVVALYTLVEQYQKY